jgi:hypothetical protein
VNEAQRAAIDQITKKFADEGCIIEGGWQIMRLLTLPPTASSVQVSEMRKAYFSGAQHLFASITSALDDDDEPTAEDLRRLELISAELRAFYDEMMAGGRP